MKRWRPERSVTSHFSSTAARSPSLALSLALDPSENWADSGEMFRSAVQSAWSPRLAVQGSVASFEATGPAGHSPPPLLTRALAQRQQHLLAPRCPAVALGHTGPVGQDPVSPAPASRASPGSVSVGGPQAWC